jgi:anti-sigma factor RsiW
MQNPLRRQRHLSDEQLLSLIESGSGDAHLSTCERCANRHAELLCAIGDLTELHAEADGIFDEHHLARQHAQILKHIDRNHGPARVLHFPAVAPAIQHGQPFGRRWVAAAAIAGLMVGIFAGWRLDHDTLGARSHQITAEARPSAGPLAGGHDGIVSAKNRKVVNDETLLVEVDAAVANPRVKELKAIDALTPAAR